MNYLKIYIWYISCEAFCTGVISMALDTTAWLPVFPTLSLFHYIGRRSRECEHLTVTTGTSGRVIRVNDPFPPPPWAHLSEGGRGKQRTGSRANGVSAMEIPFSSFLLPEPSTSSPDPARMDAVVTHLFFSCRTPHSF